MNTSASIPTLHRNPTHVFIYRSQIIALWCITPALVLMIITIIIPFLSVLIFSLTDYQLGAVHFNWIGFDNFERAFADQDVRNAITNTLFFAAIVVPIASGLGLFFALLVHQRKRSRRFYEVAFLLPITATSVVISIVWSFILQDEIGPAAALLNILGLPSIEFLSNPDMVLPSLAIVGVWQQICFSFILFLAGLTTIPKELYEAAALDGAAGGWERFRRVTWPHVAPTALVVVLLITMHAFRVFDLVVVMTQGGPAGRSDVILYKTYLEAFSYFRIGYGSALTLIFVVMVSAIAALQFLLATTRRVA